MMINGNKKHQQQPQPQTQLMDLKKCISISTGTGSSNNNNNKPPMMDGLALIQRGNEYFFSNCYLEATGYYYQAAMLLKGSKEHRVQRSKAWSNVAECHLRLQNWQAAEDAASNALGADPRNSKALYRRAKARFELGDYMGAAKDADAVGTDDAQDVAALCRELADAALNRGGGGEAAAAGGGDGRLQDPNHNPNSHDHNMHKPPRPRDGSPRRRQQQQQKQQPHQKPSPRRQRPPPEMEGQEHWLRQQQKAQQQQQSPQQQPPQQPSQRRPPQMDERELWPLQQLQSPQSQLRPQQSPQQPSPRRQRPPSPPPPEIEREPWLCQEQQPPSQQLQESPHQPPQQQPSTTTRRRRPPPPPPPPSMEERELWLRRIIDSYRLRVDDEYTQTGACDASCLYGIRAKGGYGSSLEEYPIHHFRSYVQRALKKRVLPLWFTLKDMDRLCQLATTDPFSNINVAGVPEEIEDYYATELGLTNEIALLRDLALYIEGPIGMPWDDDSIHNNDNLAMLISEKKLSPTTALLTSSSPRVIPEPGQNCSDSNSPLWSKGFFVDVDEDDGKPLPHIHDLAESVIRSSQQKQQQQQPYDSATGPRPPAAAAVGAASFPRESPPSTAAGTAGTYIGLNSLGYPSTPGSSGIRAFRSSIVSSEVPSPPFHQAPPNQQQPQEQQHPQQQGQNNRQPQQATQRCCSMEEEQRESPPRKSYSNRSAPPLPYHGRNNNRPPYAPVNIVDKRNVVMPFQQLQVTQQHPAENELQHGGGGSRPSRHPHNDNNNHQQAQQSLAVVGQQHREQKPSMISNNSSFVRIGSNKKSGQQDSNKFDMRYKNTGEVEQSPSPSPISDESDSVISEMDNRSYGPQQHPYRMSAPILQHGHPVDSSRGGDGNNNNDNHHNHNVGKNLQWYGGNGNNNTHNITTNPNLQEIYYEMEESSTAKSIRHGLQADDAVRDDALSELTEFSP